MYFHPSPVVARHYRLRGFLRLEGLSQALAAEDVRTGWEVTLKLHINARTEHPERYPQTVEEPRTTTPFADSIAYLTQEARVLGAARGPHVAPLVEQLDDPQLGVILVVQRRAGVPFPERIRRGGRPSFDLVHAWMTEVWRALSALHTAGVVHSCLASTSFVADPRPDGQERVTLVDLGHARLAAQPQSAGPPSPFAYRDVDQARLVCGQAAPGPLDPRIDLYAAARVAADLLGYDQLVTLDPLPLEAVGQPLQQRLADLSWRGREHIRNALGPAVEAFFIRALSLDPATQLPSAAEAAAAWQALAPANMGGTPAPPAGHVGGHPQTPGGR
jgi:serine/threonine protein kinase